MLTDETRERLPEEALSILHTIWHWDYRDWDAVGNLVTGPLEQLLRANLTDEDVAPGKALLAMTIAGHSFEEDGTARVEVDYVWKETAGGDPNTERIVWFFLHEDGRWKAATLGR
ncbi:MAG: hypothetical protein Q4F72_11335 [Desulfovibrionaceae bacterium]|nr:hypothetical protein [Desulfovibrionaceae bacterium]